MQIVDDVDDNGDSQQSDHFPMLHDNEETYQANPIHENDSHHVQPSSSISLNNHQSSTSTQPNLLLVRLNLQQGKYFFRSDKLNSYVLL